MFCLCVCEKLLRMTEHLDSIFLVFVLSILCNFRATFTLRGPADVKVISSYEKGIEIEWSPVSLPNVIVEKYEVLATPVSSSGDKTARKMEWLFSNTTTKADLFGLQPASQYRVSVWAVTEKEATDWTSVVAWTEVATPEKPFPVKIVKREGEIMYIQLQSYSSQRGPVIAYRVVVLEKSDIVFFNPDQLHNYSEAQEMGLPFYIAAELSSSSFQEMFTVGDGKLYGSYYNAPLDPDSDYEIIQGIISSLNGMTKEAYSPLQSSDTSSIQHRKKNGKEPSVKTTILAAAIGVCSFLLVLSVIVYCLLRSRFGKRRASDEMILQAQAAVMEENGFIPGKLQIDEHADLGDFHEKLKEKYWQIPRSCFEVKDTVLGNGQFGEIHEGIARRRTEEIPALIHQTRSLSRLTDKDQRNFLGELYVMVELGIHPNVVEFIGACYEEEVSYLVVEHYLTTLRGHVLRSRQTSGTRATSLSDSHLLEFAVGVAEGMKHLTEKGIFHRRLSSRSILVVDGCIPKVTNFGLACFNPLGKQPDYTRWTAPEALRSCNYSFASDVWSYGVLLWEIFTLGGTPYGSVPSKDVSSRVLRGMKLAQPKGVSDELYQLMLHCWELDLDERPSFHELSSITNKMLLAPRDNLQLDLIPGFQHEPFIPTADVL